MLLQFKSLVLVLVTSLSFLVSTKRSSGQDRCGTVEVTQKLKNTKSLRETDHEFESWLRQRRSRSSSRSNASEGYIIPVVVHIVHKGEAIGTGTNISDAQVLSQISVLNKDYNRLNVDASNTPAEFQSVAGSINIGFVLAKQTPEGLPTSGIVRVRGTKSQWTTDDNTSLKSLSYWPAENYLNIWVTDLSSSLLGYAQFPVSSLTGLEDGEGNRLTDGVVIDYAVFGSKADGAFNLLSSFASGRTTTHEVGHFLGLRHIWGDDSGSCAGSDYVDDTPNQGNSTSGCPSQPQTSCGVHTMFQNYMDYTNDACMNLFTTGQVSRMATVLANSPRRVSLLSSVGAYDPAPVANDLGVQSIISPISKECAGPSTPTFQVINKGTNTIAKSRMSLTVNGTIVEVKDFTFASGLNAGGVCAISFSSFPLTTGTYTFMLAIVTTNDVTDGKLNDNQFTGTTTVRETIALPFSERFSSIPISWTISNPDGKTTWQNLSVPKDGQSNGAMYIHYYNSSEATGEKDIVLTPTFSLVGAIAPFVSFDVAYARNQNLNDGLAVYVLSNCSEDLSQGTQLYFKEGSALVTTSASNSAFTPTTENQWKNVLIDLHQFAGQSHVQLAFVGINGTGNNLYLDNIAVTGNANVNMAITDIIHPSPVSCTDAVQPVLSVHNAGADLVTRIRINYALNGATRSYATPDDFILTPGKDAEIILPPVTLTNGVNTFSAELAVPNGFKDSDTTDNRLTRKVTVNKTSDIIPLRQNFENDFQTQWTIINPLIGILEQTITTNYNQSLVMNASEDAAETWLVSPTLDLSAATTASVFFDLSYRSSEQITSDDHFKILASADCGATYDTVLLDIRGASLTTNLSSEVPGSQEDWKKYFINLDALTGLQQVRLAWVSSKTSNDLYIDNIEFFVSDNPTPQSADKPFIVYGTDPSGPSDFLVTFNLRERQSVNYDLLDVTGRQVDHGEFEDVLNQTYTLAPRNISRGIYFLRLRIGREYFSTKLYLAQ
jgi:hypothetical protein